MITLPSSGVTWITPEVPRKGFLWAVKALLYPRYSQYANSALCGLHVG